MLLPSHAALPDGALPTLDAQQLGKEYRLYDSPAQRLLSLLANRRNYRSHWALQGVSFQLRRGQCLGLIGDNGAGKSTLLKLLAGTLQPSCGTLARHGRVTAILELGAGFHPDFTGRQNLYFGGSLIGIDATQMRALEASIIAFSELGEAMDRPIKTYSSGMVVRLAFALVTALEPQVLIIDEALAVGDQHFQKKCVERIEAFRNNGCTILFCSHSLYHVQRLCDQALWLHQGHMRALGPTPEVVAAYEAHVRLQQQAEASPAEEAAAPALRPAPDAAHIEAVLLADVQEPSASTTGSCGRLDSPHLRMTVRARTPEGVQPHIGLLIEQVDGVGVTSVATHFDGTQPHQDSTGAWVATVTFPDIPLHTGQYKISAYLFDNKGLVVYDEWKDCQRFSQVFAQSTPGIVRLAHQWS
ncbi:MAG: ABC transporter [Comamonadaceae bacterium SCN 68-20]|nr:MAG: ABC transporter [Comamonadaceae bacterium SCN 68-20]OJX26263.1 MAG: ABC transporter [Burkholderiales bacterium 68-20]